MQERIGNVHKGRTEMHGWDFSGYSRISGFRLLSENNKNGVEMHFEFSPLRIQNLTQSHPWKCKREKNNVQQLWCSCLHGLALFNASGPLALCVALVHQYHLIFATPGKSLDWWFQKMARAMAICVAKILTLLDRQEEAAAYFQRAKDLGSNEAQLIQWHRKYEAFLSSEEVGVFQVIILLLNMGWGGGGLFSSSFCLRGGGGGQIFV